MYIFLRIFIIKQGSSYLNGVLCFIPPLEYFYGIRAQKCPRVEEYEYGYLHGWSKRGQWY